MVGGVLPGAGRARPASENSMVCRCHRRGTALHTRAGKFSRSRSGDLSKSAACAAPQAQTHTDPTRFYSLDGGAERQGSKKRKKARRPSGHRANFACLERDTCWLIPRKYGSNVQVIAAHPQASPFPQHDYDYIALSRAPSAVLLRTVPKTPALASDAMRASS